MESSLLARVATVSPEEAAEALGVVVGTLANWRLKGGGPRYLKVGNRVRYRVSDLEEWLSTRARGSTSER